MFEQYGRELLKGLKNSKVKGRKPSTLAGKPATEIELELTNTTGTTSTTLIRLMKTDTLGFELSLRQAIGRPSDDMVNAFFTNFELVGDTAVAASGPRPQLPQGWVDYKPKDNRFRIHLPGNPVDLSAGAYHIYSTVRVDKPVVGLVTYMENMSVEDAIAVMTKHYKQVGEKKDVTLAGRPATELVFERSRRNSPPRSRRGRCRRASCRTRPRHRATAANPALMVVRILKTDTVTYSVTISNRHAGAPPEKDVNAYFDSFEILKK